MKSRALRTFGTARIALAVAMLAVGVVTTLFTIGAVYRLHVVLPVWDEWISVIELQQLRGGYYTLDDLAMQYNEHRILIPRLFYFVDDELFGMSDRFNLAIMFLFQTASAAILIRLMMQRVACRTWRLLLAGFVLLLMFSLRQEQNFTFGFQLQFTGVFSFAMMAVLSFVDALDRLGTFGAPERRGAWARLLLAGLLCAVATYTMASGVLAGFTLLTLSLVLRAPWRVSLATAIVSTALATLYFHGYVAGRLSLPLADALAHPMAYPRFLAGLMGNILGDDLVATQEVGTVGLAGFALAAAAVAVRRTPEAAAAALLAIMGFTVASACATTYGRIGAGLAQAYEGRYVEAAAIFWCALVLFWFPVAVQGLGRARKTPSRIAGAVVVALAMALTGGGAAYFEATAWPDMVRQVAKFQRFRNSLLSGLYDKDAGRYEIFSEEDIRPQIAFLRAAKLSLFGRPAFADLGRPIASLGEAAPASACAGTVVAQADPATLGSGGVRLYGAAWDVARNRPVKRILAVGGDGRVAGFGSPDRPAGRPRTWTGYARAAVGETVSAHAVLSDGRLCDLGGAPIASLLSKPATPTSPAAP